MKRYLYQAIFLLGLVLCEPVLTAVHAQPAWPYQTTVFGTRDGLPHNSVQALCQDRNGYLWVGTEAGLSRYNGYRFDHFMEADGQPIGHVRTIMEMTDGTLWIGTENGIFTISQGKIHAITLTFRGVYRQVRSFAWDENRHLLWFACASGPFFFTEKQLAVLKKSPGTTVLQPLPHPGWQRLKPNDSRVFSLALDDAGGLWAGNSKSLFFCDSTSCRQMWHSEATNEITSLLVCGKDSLYFGGNSTTLMGCFNGQVQAFADTMFYVTDLFRHGNQSYFFSAGEMYRIDPQGIVKIWDHQIRVGISDVIIDRENNVWVATWEGLVKISAGRFRQITAPELEEIYGAGMNAEGDILFGANHGRVYRLPRGNPAAIQPWGVKICPNSNINDFFCEPSGKCWIATEYEGLSVWENGKVQRFGKKHGLHDEGLFALLPAKNSVLWAIGDGGVSRIDINEKKEGTGIPHIEPVGFLKPQEGLVSLCSGVEDPEGGLWFGGNRGLFRHTSEGLDTATIGGGNYVITGMDLDIRNRLWIATLGSGLLCCEWKEHRWQLARRYLESDGLHSSNLLAVLADSKGRIWLGYGYGIGLLVTSSAQEPEIRYFNHRDGFLKEGCRRMKILEGRDGVFWVATPVGVCSFQPAAFARNENAPLLHIRAVEIFNGTVDYLPYCDSLNADTGLPEGLALPYSLNHLRFVFDGLSLTNPENNRFRFKLVGVDNNWRIPEQGDLQAVYPKLPAGTYTFLVEAANSDGVWSAQPASFHFRILTPFWKQAWFGLVLASVFVMITVFVARRRIQQIRQREKEKTRIQAQIAELRVQALRAQINPHFIFNCLAGIQEYVLQEQFMEANTYLTRFSRLLRLTLESADKPFISLREEVDMLRLYLDLENTRLRQQIDYQIDTSGVSTEDTLQIPAFIIQPFVENAIWHGLMHSRGIKKLRVKIMAEETRLVIWISDNGIGRAAASVIGRNKIGSRESKGIDIIRERLRLLHPEASVLYEDLYDQAGASAGTCVKIEIPLVL
jgi:ligand-binding sensor domain-containing protein